MKGMVAVMSENTYEKEYRGTLIRIGASMLMLLLMFNVLFVIQSAVGEVLEKLLDYQSYYIVYQLLYGLTYAAVFFIPVAFFYILGGRRSQPVLTQVRLDRQFPLMLVASVAVILCAATINYYFMETVHFSEFTRVFIQDDPLDTNYKLVMAVFTSAIVPAFVEELLFRGVVLTNILPYGRTPAVLISAVLFGLMHQNPGQIFYATMAGVVLGLVYVRTRSIWGGVIIHFVNNLFSVFEQLLFDRLEAAQASELCTYIEGVLFLAGVICIIILIRTNKRRVRDFSESGFGRVLEPDEMYVERPLEKGRAVRQFFNPTVTIFMIISCLEMLYYIILALQLYAGVVS